MSVSSSSTRSGISRNADEEPITMFNLSNRRARLALILRTFLSILILTGWNYACDWGLQMCVVFVNYKHRKFWTQTWIFLIISAILAVAWTTIALLQFVWKQRRDQRRYWSWRRPSSGGGDDQEQAWARTTPPSMFFHVSFREAFSSEHQLMISSFSCEDRKQFLIRMLVALHVWPVFMIFIFWPFYLFILSRLSGWRLMVPSSIIVLVTSAVLYKYVISGCTSGNRQAENESFYLFPDEDPTSLSVGLLTPQQQQEDRPTTNGRQPNQNSSRRQQDPENSENYRDANNL